MEKISSAQNPKIKNLKRLEKAGERKEQGLILIEGLRETVLACRAGYRLEAVFICPQVLKTTGGYNLNEIKKTQPVVPVYELSEAVYNTLAYRETTEGVIATARPKNHSLQNLQLNANPLILVIEAVEKPGNLGAMLRTADAAGADAVIICDGKTDLYNPNVIRSAVGTAFTSQIAVCETPEAIAYLKSKQIVTYAASLEATEPHFQKNFKTAVAIVVGTEATGLSAMWLAEADEKIKIPMSGKIDSLNVSVSAGIILFEAVRQRWTK